MRAQLSSFINLTFFVFITLCCLIIWHLHYYNVELSHQMQAFEYESQEGVKTNELKLILLWSLPDMWPFRHLGHGQNVFIDNHCSRINCYVTDDKMFFGGNLTRFDAIAFNGRDQRLNDRSPQSHLPHERSPRQKYIFFNTEPAHHFPIRNSFFNGYFNWTATYRQDSEFVINYFLIKNTKGDIIGPKINMTWIKQVDDIDVGIKLSGKRFAAAWFVSRCKSQSRRENLVANLQKELEKYELVVHIYGKCGNFSCPRSTAAKCNDVLKKKYYFYLSFENSFDKDYVTEKLITALQNDVIPIVLGGADYSRFLPPGSYINAREISVKKLASLMDHLIKNPRLYRKYFWWKRYYTYSAARNVFVCALCSFLNEKTFEKYSSYDNFLLWWNPK